MLSFSVFSLVSNFYIDINLTTICMELVIEDITDVITVKDYQPYSPNKHMLFAYLYNAQRDECTKVS